MILSFYGKKPQEKKRLKSQLPKEPKAIDTRTVKLQELIMDMFDSMFSPTCKLNEQVARQIFEILPENGPIIMIMDRDGNNWPSDSDRFSKLNITASFFDELLNKIDDGDEPVVTRFGDCSVIAGQLLTEKTNCGYVVVFLPQCDSQSPQANAEFGLLEVLLAQINLIAKLIEQNSHLYELQMKYIPGSDVYIHSETALN